jgi:hypothetical protein
MSRTLNSNIKIMVKVKPYKFKLQIKINSTVKYLNIYQNQFLHLQKWNQLYTKMSLCTQSKRGIEGSRGTKNKKKKKV